MRNFIGIDYSLTSVGITVITEKNSIKHYSFLNRFELSTAKNFNIKNVPKYKTQGLEGLDQHFLFERPPVKFNKKEKDTFVRLNNWHRGHMESCQNINKPIEEFLRRIVGKNDVVSIEHYITSRNSGGDQTIQIIEATKQIKDVILSITKNLFVVSAPTIKNFAGSGDYSKKQMLEVYLCQNFSHPWKENLKKNKENFVKNEKTILKPIDDVVDSYFIAKHIKEKFQTLGITDSNVLI